MENDKKIEWKKEYETGNRQIDQEHQQLFDLANRVVCCEPDQDKVTKTSQELISYTKYHFANEEKYMESINYPFLEQHKNQHKEIVNQLNRMLFQMNFIKFEDISNNLCDFIRNIILKHILDEDKKFI